jgi:transcriptional regulator of arginine metabolism
MSVPQTMTARRARIRELLTSTDVASQDHLRLLLAAEGVHVTQATLSRDLDRIGAIKDTSRDGAVRYIVPADPVIARLAPPGGMDTAARIVAEVLVSAEAAQNLVVLRTPPGAAMYLAGTLDRAVSDDIVGTVAGDDTVMVVMRSNEAAGDLCTRLLELAEGRKSGETSHNAVAAPASRSTRVGEYRSNDSRAAKAAGKRRSS